MDSMNGADIFRTATTIFVRIPEGLAQPISGGCRCTYCTAHPEQQPRWDCLAISVEPEQASQPGHSRPDTAWTVHFPDFFSREQRAWHVRK